MSGPAVKERLYALARRYSNQLAAERSMSLEAQLLEIIHDLLKADRVIAVKDIAEKSYTEQSIDGPLRPAGSERYSESVSHSGR
jgi:hypothetical protein